MYKLYIYNNNTELSEKTKIELKRLLPEYNMIVVDEYSDEVDLIACIGGDGTFLNFVHACNFPACPIIGINTGHLGFFQEAVPSEIEECLKAFTSGQYTLQTIKPIKAKVCSDGHEYEYFGLNEIMIRGPHTHITHLCIDIDGTVVQDFCGDGILVSTNVGSTAYNYSLGGAIVAPELDVLQLTPVAPSNTNAYRCFHSSIIYPSNKELILSTLKNTKDDEIIVTYDGLYQSFDKVSEIRITQSEIEINLIRYNSYSYWAKLKDKLL